MEADRQREVTTLLEAIRSGNPGARDQLVALIYDELRRLSSGLLRRERLPSDDVLDHFAQQRLDLLAVHEALNQLAGLHERQSQVVELRFFGGYTVEEIAEQLAVSVSTVESDFRKATAFLRSRLVDEGGDDPAALPAPR